MPKINLRNEARGRECQIRIPNVCNRNPDTTVLAHSNKKALFMAGTGLKVPDIFGAWACSACHDAVDGRTQYPYDELENYSVLVMFYDGIMRTQNILLQEGKIGVIE